MNGPSSNVGRGPSFDPERASAGRYSKARPAPHSDAGVSELWIILDRILADHFRLDRLLPRIASSLFPFLPRRVFAPPPMIVATVAFANPPTTPSTPPRPPLPP